MSSYSMPHDVNHSFYAGQIMNNNPRFPNFWRNDPLNSDTLVDPRRAGFRPYLQYGVVSKWPPFDPTIAVYQLECDLILPINKVYSNNPQQWIEELFLGR